MYAIIATGGKQDEVSEGDVVTVEKLGAEAGDKVVFDQVLLVSNDGKIQTGAPTVSGATVEAEVLRQMRDKKVIVMKYKPKTGYKRKNGHRQYMTQVKISKINA